MPGKFSDNGYWIRTSQLVDRFLLIKEKKNNTRVYRTCLYNSDDYFFIVTLLFFLDKKKVAKKIKANPNAFPEFSGSNQII